jgi:hypothetical protein
MTRVVLCQQEAKEKEHGSDSACLVRHLPKKKLNYSHPMGGVILPKH